MNVKQIETELGHVSDRLAKLRRQVDEQVKWEAELRTALRVLSRLNGTSEPLPRDTADATSAVEHTVVRTTTVRDKDGAVFRKTYGRVRPLATGLPAQAGQALIEMLRVKGQFIKPKEAVERLKEEHNIRIGIGKPGRETSDLSSAIGHGRVSGLVVTRQDGWGLEEWKGIPPVERDP